MENKASSAPKILLATKTGDELVVVAGAATLVFEAEETLKRPPVPKAGLEVAEVEDAPNRPPVPNAGAELANKLLVVLVLIPALELDRNKLDPPNGDNVAGAATPKPNADADEGAPNPPNGAEAAGEAPKSEDVNGEGDDDDEDGFVLNENPAIVGGIQ
ncbi:hypothetical protein Tco_1451890 [Tanacetum coccineum]